MKRSLTLALLSLVLLAAKPVSAMVRPYLTLETAGPYSIGTVITFTAHGDIPGHPGETTPKTHIRMLCYQSGQTVDIDFVYSPAAETPYQFTIDGFPSDPDPGYCVLDFYKVSYHPIWYQIVDLYTEFTFNLT